MRLEVAVNDPEMLINPSKTSDHSQQVGEVHVAWQAADLGGVITALHPSCADRWKAVDADDSQCFGDQTAR